MNENMVLDHIICTFYPLSNICGYMSIKPDLKRKNCRKNFDKRISRLFLKIPHYFTKSRTEKNLLSNAPIQYVIDTID